MTDNEIEMQTAADLQELAQAVFSEAGLNPVLNQHEAGRELARAVLKTGHRGVCNCAYCRCERLLARADAAESRAAELVASVFVGVALLERQLAHEQTLRKSAEERVVELERLIASVGDLAPKLRWESHADCAAWLDAAANHHQREELKAELRASVEAAERKRGGGR